MKRFAGVTLVLLAGCSSGVPFTATSGGGNDGAASAIISAVSAEASAARSDMGVTSAGAGAASTSASETVPVFDGGGPVDEGPLGCNAPYAGPSVGPRVDGPLDLGSCDGISDQDVFARYSDFAARVPQGLYYESTESIAFWSEPCSRSQEETVARGAPEGMGTFVASNENEWFYEAVYCYSDLRRVARALRCDYFDGHKLSDPTPEGLAFLASMIWGAKYGQFSTSAILGHALSRENETDVVEVCSMSVTLGDFGLCDEIRLESTKHQLKANGSVELGSPQVVRTLKGRCH